ncbi:MAG: hypothetical protein JJU07_16425 [Natronohydrobacter sp.]|nr:hypothetical protein [Natronohydrobacter sp.]
MTQVTTLEDLLPLLEGATTAREFGAVVIAHVPQRPRGLRQRLACEACDALGHDWTDGTLRDWLKPGRHTEERIGANREAAREASRRWRSENAEAHRERKRRWYEGNPDYNTAYKNWRYAEDPSYALARATRSRVHHALKAAVGSPGKARPTMELLGCSAEDYRLHLESMWEPGMTWENWSPDGWHIDHVRPLASFDLSDPGQQAKAFHYTNTRPLWSKDNLSKGSLHGGTRHRHGA